MGAEGTASGNTSVQKSSLGDDMQETPLLSILVTFCNQVQYIDDCLRSIIMQKTHYPFEVLIALDGKDDGSMARLSWYAERYDFIHFWKVESDARLLSLSRASRNRLFLLERAKGRYLIVLDGDDFFCSTYRFEKGVQFLEEHQEFIAHACEWIKYDDEQKNFIHSPSRQLNSLNLDFYIEKNIYIHIASCIFRNIFLFNKKIFEYKDFFNDTCLVYFILNYGKIMYTDEQMFGYRVGIESTFASLDEEDKKILEFTTTIIKNNITHGKLHDNIVYYINNKLNLNISNNIKQSILFQNIPVVSNLIRINDETDLHKRWLERKSIYEYLTHDNPTPVLSVLITFCKERDYINECLQSILKQKTSYPYEILVAVDGEDDGSMELLAWYQKSYPFLRVWKVDSDSRLLPLSRASQNRLFLLERSRGRYFLTLDGDDFFCSTSHFEKAIRHLEYNPSCIGFASSWMFYDQDKSFQDKHIYQNCDYTIQKIIDNECYLHVSCCVFKNIKDEILKFFNDKYYFDNNIIIYFMCKYGNMYISSSVDFVHRIKNKYIYSTQYEYTKKITNIIEWYKIFEMTNCDFAKYKLIEFVKHILKVNNDITPGMKKSIYFQNIPIVKDIVKLNNKSLYYSIFIKLKLFLALKKIYSWK